MTNKKNKDIKKTKKDVKEEIKKNLIQKLLILQIILC